MKLIHQITGNQLNAADMKIIKGGWSEECYTYGECTKNSDCRIYPRNCLSPFALQAICYENNCTFSHLL